MYAVFVLLMAAMFVLGCSAEAPQPQNYLKVNTTGEDCATSVELGISPKNGSTSFNLMNTLK